MRHGRESKSRRIDGHKTAVVMDKDSQLIATVDVLPGNTAENLEPLDLVEQGEASAGVPVFAGYLLTQIASWWLQCRDAPTAITFPRTT